MNEAHKTYALWPDNIRNLVTGHGIDIGSGNDPISKTAIPFDREQGDANHILKYVATKFDFVFSSHCLEHMYDPQSTIQEWWQLVKPGGVLIVIVPDEDLYEQGMFPSVFNFDHKHTFTISKHQSWSSKSINMFDLASSLPNGTIERLTLQDHGYDRSKVIWGSPSTSDQTRNDMVLAQIECIIRKNV